MVASKEQWIVAVDIGGTWVKGCTWPLSAVEDMHLEGSKAKMLSGLKNIVKVPGLGQDESWAPEQSIEQLIEKLNVGGKVCAIGISTFGIVDDSGQNVVRALAKPLLEAGWKKKLEKKFTCKIVMMNDAEAALMGAVELGYMPAKGVVALFSLGTGLGVALWRNGKRWRPHGKLALLGGLRVPDGRYEKSISASGLAARHPEKDLVAVLASSEYKEPRQTYFRNLADACQSAAILYDVDECLITGGLANAAEAAQFDLRTAIEGQMLEVPPEIAKLPEVKILKEGNQAQLIGAAVLAMSEYMVESEVNAEKMTPDLKHYRKNKNDSVDLVEDILEETRTLAGDLNDEAEAIVEAAQHVAISLLMGGRLILVGNGLFGRAAVKDVVQIAMASGAAPASVVAVCTRNPHLQELESEDASSVSEMLFLNIGPRDTVVGCSIAGSLLFSRSALVLAKNKKAFCVDVSREKSTSANQCITFEVNNDAEGVAVKTILNLLWMTAWKTVLNIDNDPLMLSPALQTQVASILSLSHNFDQEKGERLFKKTQNNFQKILMELKK